MLIELQEVSKQLERSQRKPAEWFKALPNRKDQIEYLTFSVSQNIPAEGIKSLNVHRQKVTEKPDKVRVERNIMMGSRCAGILLKCRFWINQSAGGF